MPVAVLALAVGYRAHRQPLPLGLGAAALGIAYLHVFGGTPEWTLYGVLGASGLAAIMDWRAARTRAPRASDALLRWVRMQ